MAEKIGFIGLGTMGGPMCRRLIADGFEVVVFDIDPRAVAEASEWGAHLGGSARETAVAVDVLCTSLPHPDNVETVMEVEGALSALRAGSMWIDLTTNDRLLVERLARAAPDGVGVCDAPVTGAVDGARAGTLTLFLGGAETDRARATPILECLGTVIQCGPLGTGNVVKLVTNQLWFIHAAAIGEGFALGMANGVELGTLWRAIRESVADSFVARHDAPSIFAGHYDPSFPLDLCLKDLRLISDLSDRVESPLELTEGAHRLFARAGERYGLSAGEMHVVKQLEDDTGLSMRLPGDWTPPWEQGPPVE